MNGNIQAAHDAYQTLYDQIDDAYWLSSAEARPKLLDAKDGISDVLDKLEADDLASRNGALGELAATFADVNARLALIRDSAAALLRGVSTATQIASGIDSAIKTASQFVQ